MPKVIIFVFIALVVVLAVFSTRQHEAKIEQSLPEATNVPVVPDTSPSSYEQAGTRDEYSFAEIGLNFSTPSEMEVTGELIDTNTFNLTVQRGQYPAEEYYQLYGIFRLEDTNFDPSSIDTQNLKEQLAPESIKERVVGGFPAIQGQYKGERNRLVTFVITDRGLFTLATAQPTPQNGELTDDILDTFTFKQ